MGKTPPTLLSIKLARVALIIWFLSLPFEAYLIQGDTGLLSFEILLEGWLGPLVLMPAWYANIFFFYGIIKLNNPASEVGTSAAFALFISLPALYFTYIPHISGGMTVLWGVGPGAILWMSSIFIFVIAASARDIELEHKSDLKSIRYFHISNPQAILTSLLFLTFISSIAYLAAPDIYKAESTDAKTLKLGMYKYDPVCEVPTIRSKNIIEVSGPVEIISNSDLYSSGFSRPSFLLEQGVPVVRKDGLDYALSNPANKHSVVITPAKNPADIVLEVRSVDNNDGSVITARLTSKDGIEAFSGEWNNKDIRRGGSVFPGGYCPEFNSADLISKSLVNQNGKPIKAVHKSNGDNIFPKKYVFPKVLSVEDLSGSIDRAVIQNNIGCDKGTRVETNKNGINFQGHMLKPETHRVFINNDKAMHLLYTIREPKIICTGDYVYFHHFNLNLNPFNKKNINGVFRIIMTKFSKDGMVKQWEDRKIIEVTKEMTDLPKAKAIDILSIKETEASIVLDLAYFTKDMREGKVIRVTTPHPHNL